MIRMRSLPVMRRLGGGAGVVAGAGASAPGRTCVGAGATPSGPPASGRRGEAISGVVVSETRSYFGRIGQ